MIKEGNVSKLVSYRDWEEKAKGLLDICTFDYISEGAGEELTVKENRNAMVKYKICPRVLMGTSEVSISTSLLGLKMKSPMMLAPVGGLGKFYPHGDFETAKAAAITETPFCVSTVSTKSMEEIADKMGSSTRFFQLYLYDDDTFNRNLVERAEKSGYLSIMLTVDGPSIGRRLRSLRNGFSISEFTSGNFTSNFFRQGGGNKGSALPSLKRNISWNDVDTLLDMTGLSVVLKGITNPQDAEIALEHGVKGVVVSNHGGRQVDGGISTIDALMSIRQVTEGKMDLIVDGGIRTGSDIIKALCLGANAVMIGRPYIYALVVAGSNGVQKVIVDLLNDLRISMLNAGIQSIEQMDESYVTRV